MLLKKKKKENKTKGKGIEGEQGGKELLEVGG